MRVLTIIVALVGLVSLSACNTVRGMGQDIENAGAAVKNAGSR
ncbi:MAG: entericidin A/B family lipoprotein [Thiobacillaceae bacterium]